MVQMGVVKCGNEPFTYFLFSSSFICSARSRAPFGGVATDSGEAPCAGSALPSSRSLPGVPALSFEACCTIKGETAMVLRE
jgi:hypothetical protein